MPEPKPVNPDDLIYQVSDTTTSDYAIAAGMALSTVVGLAYIAGRLVGLL